MTISDFYLKDIWTRTLTKLKETGQIDDNVFEVYFTSSRLYSLSDEQGALILVQNYIDYHLMMPYKELIERCMEEVTHQYIPVKVVLESSFEETQKKNASFTNEFINRTVDPNHTFANFVVGRSNAQAQVAALTCATNPGMIYNPLFIYGNSGLGKTHLLNAIGNHVINNSKNKKVGFISGLEFVEGVYNSIKDKRIDDFKNSFYDLDLLLVDDIQFIAGKEKTHEVFFQIFQYLDNNRKQICITADKRPEEIKGLEDRIISRFNRGLNVSIEAPEFETSINILKMKISNNIQSSYLAIDDDVLSYIASNFSQDVRSLEGAINRLIFYVINFSDSTDDHITLKMAVDAFKDQITENKNELNIATIRKTVCDYYSLTKQQIISKNRTKNIANARHIAMYLCRKLLDAPYKDIGNEFGKRDHSTVMSACERVEKLIKTDPAYLKAINDIEARVR